MAAAGYAPSCPWHRLTLPSFYRRHRAKLTLGRLSSAEPRFSQMRRSSTSTAALEELILRHALGMPLHGFVRETGASGVMMLPIPQSGVLRQVSGLEAALEVPGIEGLEITIPIGQTVVSLPEGNRYLGFLFAKAGTPDQVETALRVAHARMEVEVEPA